jgi:hypothetical protein
VGVIERIYHMGNTDLIRVGTTSVALAELSMALGEMTQDEFLTFLRQVIAARKADELREVLDAIEIMGTQSAFVNADKTCVLEQIAEEYPFSWWLEQTGKGRSRAALIEYWDFFRVMSASRGFTVGTINNIGQSTNLWKATGPLAVQMLRDPARYCYLPAILINNAEQVAKKLSEIADPIAVLEVLVGEAFEDMAKSPKFLGAFSTTDKKNAEGAIASIMLCLQS